MGLPPAPVPKPSYVDVPCLLSGIQSGKKNIAIFFFTRSSQLLEQRQAHSRHSGDILNEWMATLPPVFPMKTQFWYHMILSASYILLML